MTSRILVGDVRERLRDLPDGSIHCCVTSPPYYGLRDYGVAGQIGLELTLAEYITNMVDVFREVRRVLRDDGTVFLNIGDSYATDTAGWRKESWAAKGAGVKKRTGTPPGLKPKDLMLVPERLALALQQPYTAPTCVKEERDRAWLAAMFDGEGCIGIRRHDSHRRSRSQEYQDGYIVYTSMTNNDLPLLDRCIEITGKGSARIKQRAAATDGRGIVSRFDSHGWRLDGNSAVDVIRAIYPYLIAKRKQAILAYNLDLSNKGGRELRGNGELPANEQAKRALLYDLIKRANQREHVDMPSWCVEPTQEVIPGWWIRSRIIWAKKACMPESVTDRPTSAHEHIWLLTKASRYFYDAESVREEAATDDPSDPSYRANGKSEGRVKGIAVPPGSTLHGGMDRRGGQQGRNQRNVWHLGPEPFPDAHFATFPTEIPRRCIKAGCPEGGTVLDPFLGSGTTLMVADQLGRHGIGIELNPEYAAMAERRIRGDAPLFAQVDVA